MFYHVSPTAGLKMLQPRASTHGTPYVYAIENRVTGLLFGARQDDFDLMIDSEADGRPVVCECRPGVLQAVYQGKSCSVYEVDEAGFLRGVTGWDPELVNPQAVAVQAEIVVTDLYRALLAAEAAGELVLRRYTDSSAYRQMVAEHLVDRLLRFEVDLAAIQQNDARFAGPYRALVQGLQAVLDGHLLP